MTSKILNVDAVAEINFLNAKGEFRVCVRNKARVYFVTSVCLPRYVMALVTRKATCTAATAQGLVVAIHR